MTVSRNVQKLKQYYFKAFTKVQVRKTERYQ